MLTFQQINDRGCYDSAHSQTSSFPKLITVRKILICTPRRMTLKVFQEVQQSKNRLIGKVAVGDNVAVLTLR